MNCAMAVGQRSTVNGTRLIHQRIGKSIKIDSHHLIGSGAGTLMF